MLKYQYQIVQYRPDVVTSEFINLGVIVYSPDTQFLKAKVTNNISRIHGLFPAFDAKQIIKLAKQIVTEVEKTANKFNELFPASRDLTAITKSILLDSDSSIILSPTNQGIDIHLDAALDGIYTSVISKYDSVSSDSTPEKKSLTSKKLWDTKYKAFFQKYQITRHLQKHTVKTQFNDIPFEHAWKNEIWHCYEAVSFDGATEKSIKNKVYNLSGKVLDLSTTKEKLHLTFLSSYPTQMEPFIKSLLYQDKGNITVDIVHEQEAEAFAQKLGAMIAAHN